MQNSSHTKPKDRPYNKTIARIKKNDSAFLKQLYTLNFAKVKRYVLKNNGSDQEAKDLYQEAFVAMWRNVKNDKFSAASETAINGYLFKIAKYKWLDHLRSARYKNTTFINREIEFDETQTEEEEAKTKKINLIMKSIDQLDKKCQLLLKLFYFERKPYKEIAKIINIDEASARNAKYRCQERLKKLAQTIIPNGSK
jgi:RNA polymerase sigma factor (sigma-70 family)